MFGTQGFGSTPGLTTQFDAEEIVIAGRVDEPESAIVLENVTLASTATDTGNTDDTLTLRAGLILAKDSNGEYIEYDETMDTESDDSIPRGILFKSIDMRDASGTAEDKGGALMVVEGIVRAAQIINLTQAVRNAFAGRIRFDDDPQQSRQTGPLTGMRQRIATSGEMTAGITLTDADSGTMYIVANAGTITLPELTASNVGGHEFLFVNTADVTLTVDMHSNDGGNMIGLDNAAADQVATSTASEKTGAIFLARSVRTAAEYEWIILNLSQNTLVFT